MKREDYIMTIKAEDRLGLLHLIIGTIEKRQAEIKSLNAAPTDVHGIILITVEVVLSESSLTSLALKLENVIEVFSVEARQKNKVICLRAAYFKINKTFLDTPKASSIQKSNNLIVNWYQDAFLLAHHGNENTVRELYNELDGPYLIGFSQTGLISDTSLIDSDSEERVTINNNFEIEEAVIRMAA